MSTQQGIFSSINGTNFIFQKLRMRVYLQALGIDVWQIVKNGYQYLASILIDNVGKKKYNNNEKAIHVILENLDESESVKFMQLCTTKEILEKIVQSYEGDTKVKSAKIKTYTIYYETLRVHDDERIASSFLIVDIIFNTMKNFHDEIKVMERGFRNAHKLCDSKEGFRHK